jgi:hypothetical protein
MKGCWQIFLRSLQIWRSCAPRVPASLQQQQQQEGTITSIASSRQFSAVL